MAYLAEKLRVVVAECTVGRHLHRLGWTLVRPSLTVSSPDSDYARKVAELESLQAQAGRGEIALLFADEADLDLLPGVTRCWTRVGEQRKVLTPGSNQKRYAFGAVHYTEGTVVSSVSERKDSAGFCALLEVIVARYCPGPVWKGLPVVVVADNYVIHKSKATQQVLAKYADRLRVFSLPTYSPELNVIERLWRYLRSQVTHNHLFASIEELVQAVKQFFTNLAADRGSVLSIIGSHTDAHQATHIPNNLCTII